MLKISSFYFLQKDEFIVDDDLGDEVEIEYLDVIDVIDPWKYLERVELYSFQVYSDVLSSKEDIFCLVSYLIDQFVFKI